MSTNKATRRVKIKKRIRGIVKGTTTTPRLTVFRSNKEIYAQIIDDTTGKTLVSAGSLKTEEAHKGSKIEQAAFVGQALAKKATDAGISKVCFDRNGYLYHGRVKALADSARENGLIF